MFTPHTRSPWLRLSMPAVALLSLFGAESFAQSLSAAGVRNQDQGTASLEVFVFHRPPRVAMGVHGAGGMHEMRADPFAPDATTKLGLEWKPAKATLGLERGAIGLQLDSGYRLSLRTRRGGAALYLRGSF